MKVEDFILPPCSCGECRQAGVADREQRRDPRTGEILHGYPLKRWYEAREQFFQQWRTFLGKREA